MRETFQGKAIRRQAGIPPAAFPKRRFTILVQELCKNDRKLLILLNAEGGTRDFISFESNGLNGFRNRSNRQNRSKPAHDTRITHASTGALHVRQEVLEKNGPRLSVVIVSTGLLQ